MWWVVETQYFASLRLRLCISETQRIASLHGLAHNNGFDLSLSFSLIAQSKAPLEKNIKAKVMFDFGIGNFSDGFVKLS